jgi:hypothetical protein
MQGSERTAINKRRKEGTIEKILFPVYASLLTGFVMLVTYLGLNCHHLTTLR